MVIPFLRITWAQRPLKKEEGKTKEEQENAITSPWFYI